MAKAKIITIIDSMNSNTYMIISDIHGDSAALETAIDHFKTRGAEKILICGDLLYHGPRNDLIEGYEPKRCIELLNKYRDKILTVRGNCDAEVDQMVLDFPILSDSAWVTLEKNNEVKTVLMHHGHKPINSDCFDGILSGHTHIPVAIKENGTLIFNPGSISLPREDNPSTLGFLNFNKVEIIELKTGKKIKEIEW